MASSNRTTTRRLFSIILFLLYSISLAAILILFYTGKPFYQADAQERFTMAAYRSWRPAGDIGHGFGVVGSAMMVLMLLYSVRKRTRLFGELGHVSYWLQIHIFFGIIGPLFIVLHTSFRLNGLVAVSFWAMIAVALSGILGRYLYLQLPRNVFGEEMDLEQAKEVVHKLQAQLIQCGLTPEQITKIQVVASPEIPRHWSTFRILITLFLQDFSKSLRLSNASEILHQFNQLTPTAHKEIILIVKEQALLRRRVQLWNSFHSLFHYWHVIHRPFAMIMYLIMLVHIAVAFWLGYTWKF